MAISPLRAVVIAALTVTAAAPVAGQRPRPQPPLQPQPLSNPLAVNPLNDADVVSISADRLLADRVYPPGEGQIGVRGVPRRSRFPRTSRPFERCRH
jgi:hypothetical protein